MRYLLAACAFVGLVGQATAADLSGVLLVQDFNADGNPGQCNGAAHNRIVSAAGDWSPNIRIDTDNRDGGCLYSIGIVDFTGGVSGLELEFDFTADGHAGQCLPGGNRKVPISSNVQNPSMTDHIRMDMDNRDGGCPQTWRVNGRDDVALDIVFYGDDDAGQCGPLQGGKQNPIEVLPGQAKTIRHDTDGRAGGCQFSLRLRAM